MSTIQNNKKTTEDFLSRLLIQATNSLCIVGAYLREGDKRRKKLAIATIYDLDTVCSQVRKFLSQVEQKNWKEKNKKEKYEDVRKLNESQTKVYSYHTKHKHGFLKEEIDNLLKEYPNINMDKFNDALIGITGMLVMKGKDKGKLLIYHCDVEKALRCGLENRNLHHFEWD